MCIKFLMVISNIILNKKIYAYNKLWMNKLSNIVAH